jgi:hypothetical protein
MVLVGYVTGNGRQSTAALLLYRKHPHFLQKLEFLLYGTGTELKLIVKVAAYAIKSGIKATREGASNTRGCCSNLQLAVNFIFGVTSAVA